MLCLTSTRLTLFFRKRAPKDQNLRKDACCKEQCSRVPFVSNVLSQSLCSRNLLIFPRSLKVIGHNAGTSMDGVDLVLVHFTQDSPLGPLNMQLLHYSEYSMPQPLKRRVLRLIKENRTTPEEMAIVNIQLGEVIADAVHSFAKTSGFDVSKDVDLIAGQGQTIWHLPLPELFEGDQVRAHLDMAEIAIIAARTGATALGNFRVSDMALGRYVRKCSLCLATSEGYADFRSSRSVKAVRSLLHSIRS